MGSIAHASRLDATVASRATIGRVGSVIRFVAAGATLVVLVACGSDDGASPPTPPAASTPCTADQRVDPDDPTACRTLGWSACPAGFVADPEGFGCREVLPADASACAAGTMPVLGQTTCVAVTTTACAAKFEADPSGWGCRPVMPSAACTGATREALGSTTCVSVGDCGAPFPPAAATLFVDPAAPLDATHFHTIAAALAAAPDGATIAIASGTYTESLSPTKSATLVGRCAANVTITDTADLAGIHALSAIDFTLTGATLSGHLFAVAAEGGAHVTLRDAVLEANRGIGITALGVGTMLTLERSVVRATVASGAANGGGLDISAGARAVITDSTIADNAYIGVHARGSGTNVTLDGALVLRTGVEAAGDLGIGVFVRDGASGTLKSTVVRESHETGVSAFGKGTTLAIADSVVSGTLDSKSGYGRGVIVDTGTATIDRTTIDGNTDDGVIVEYGGQLTAHDVVVTRTKPAKNGENGQGLVVYKAGVATFSTSAFVGNAQSGIAAIEAGSAATLDHSVVAQTKLDNTGDRGFGVDLESGGAVTLTSSALVANGTAGIGALDPGSKATLTSTIIAATTANASGAGGRALAIESGAAATVSQCAFVANRDIAVAVREKNSTATISETVIRATAPRKDGTHGRGVEVDDGASVTLTKVSVLASQGVAVCALGDGSTLFATDAWIADTAAESAPGGAGRAATVQGGATLTLAGVVAQRSRQAGFVAAGGATMRVTGSRVEDVAADPGSGFGHGVIAFQDALVVLDDVTVRRAESAGVVFDDARGTLHACRITDNAVGIAAQDGAVLRQADAVPDDPDPLSVVVSSDTKFESNATRVSSDAVPLPSPIE